MTTTPRSIVILTGAGISAESGVSTFRDKHGIWSRYDFREVATPEGFRANPGKVLEFYNMRRRAHAEVVPNAAHEALARLEAAMPGQSLIVTQNVDELHERAGSRAVLHMHGEVFRTLCGGCGHRHADREPLSLDRRCPGCDEAGGLRPDVVWFGETPYGLDAIIAAVTRSRLFVSIGTSGTVAPASHLVVMAKRAGARTLELNLEPSQGASHFDEARHGPATELVPAFVDELLARIERSAQ